jgi:hypothetical protein
MSAPDPSREDSNDVHYLDSSSKVFQNQSHLIKISDINNSPFPRIQNLNGHGEGRYRIYPRAAFELPRHDLKTIYKIVSELTIFRGCDFNLKKLEHASEVGFSVIVANLGFLRSMKIVPDAGHNMDPDAIMLSSSIRLGDEEEISYQWRIFIQRSKFLTELIEWISAQGKVRHSRLIFQLIGMAGREATRENIRGARTAIETLVISRLVEKVDSYIMISGANSSFESPSPIQVESRVASGGGSINLHLHFGSGEIPEEVKNLLRLISLKL